jgi:HEAT repeat protein
VRTTSELLVQALWGIGGVLTFLFLFIVGNKAMREIRERRAAALREELEPKILAYMNGKGERLGPQLGHLHRLEREVAEEVLLDHARFLKGAARTRITAACEELSFVQNRLAQLRHARWWRRSEAAEKLGAMKSPRSAPELIALMRDPVPDVRMRAARALGQLDTRTSVRPLLEALQDPSRWSSLRVAEILAGMGPEAADELVDIFHVLPVKARVAAVDCLGRAKGVRAPGLLLRLLSDPDRDIRARAAHSLGLIGDPNFTPDVLKTLSDPEWPVRAMAAKALGKLGRPEAVEALGSALKDKEWWVRINAAEALRSMGDKGLAALTDALSWDDRFARHAAVATLEGAGVVDQFVEKLASHDAAEQEKALAFIRKIVASERTDSLSQSASRHALEKVREQLGRVLQPPGEVKAS